MLILFLLISLLLIALYMVFLAHHDTIDYRTINDKSLPNDFDGFNIYFISDVHRRKINMRTLRSIHEKIDIVVIGGDLTEKGVSLDRTRINIKSLNILKAPIYFVWGNHDPEADSKLFELLIEEDVTVLADENKIIRRGKNIINLLGFDYHQDELNRTNIDWDNLTDDYTILMTHVPIVFFNLTVEKRRKMNLVLAGHTHGGQIRFFGLGYYQNGGLSIFESTNVLVSEGYGYTLLPFRLQTKSQCHVLTLRR